VHTVDIVLVCTALAIVAWFALILARERYMLRAAGAIPLAMRIRSGRWVYGIARYVDDELRYYRAFGLGTRPSRVLHRSSLVVASRRDPAPDEVSALPAQAVVIECQDAGGPATLAFGANAYTGFISWLEAAAPHA
jgi:uncharacterized protein DUF2550